ncbi:hypothetical protein MSBR3_2671 [Methanosarcina barkeri 3]|uniref:GTPases-Sulfate adenylate transferase subunit 1 n=1 Tax=Methanosarcina barkeri 3 TaxID=1434107 RepID=A0A0E3WXU0_METBA|nr:hypothetical protein [Methanosarcina barkeri]AKB83249.1 hypothetical protein MSBR3_2671 [Methanosarcina barkeri 3]
MKCNKSGTGIFLLVMLLASIALIPAASAQENATKKDLSFGPETLDKLKNDPNFIAAYGSIPSFGSSEEREKWLDKLDKIYSESNSEMSEYMYPNGPVTNYGYTFDGVLKVAVNKTVEEPFMGEIYHIFDSKASSIGIKEVPLVFMREDLVVPVDEVTPAVKQTNLSTSKEENNEKPNNSSSNNSESDNDSNPSENDSSKNNSTPGFGLLGNLTCLYGGWKLKKK